MSVYADLYRYRELFANLFRRDLQTRYKGSVLGVGWSLVNPLILMAIYVLVFSTLWKVTGDIAHYPLYLLTGLVVWVFFSTALSMSARSLVAGAPLVKKVRFPRQLVPLSSVATQLVTYVVMLVAVMIANVIVIPETRDTFLLALPLSVPLIALTGGICLALACANVVFRDVEHLVAAALLPWFFLTPILYSFDQLPGGLKRPWVLDILHWGNPLTPPLEAIRAPLYEGKLPSGWDVLYLCVGAVVALALGAWVFRRVDDRIAVDL